MDNQLPLQIVPKPRGTPLLIVLVAALVLALVGLGGVVTVLYLTRSDKAKIVRQVQALQAEQERGEIAREQAAREAALALARNRQNEVLAQVRNATNALERLLRETRQVSSDAAALKTNEAGRSVALHPDLVAQARRFYETELGQLPATNDILSKLEGARRIEQQLLSAQGTTYEPAADLLGTTQNAAVWAEQGLQKVKQVQTVLSTLVQESKIKVSSASLTPASPTLDEAMTQLTQAESAARQRSLAQAKAAAEAQAADTVAKAEAQRIAADAQIQASNSLFKVQQEEARQRREQTESEAQAKLEDSKTRVAAQQAEDEARRVEQRQKATEPQVQAKLGPFITPGYYQIKGATPEKKPLSYSQLQSIGALLPTQVGLRKLHDVAHTDNDRVRPRWRFPGGWTGWLRNSEAVATVTEAQNLLIELGPVLVEMGLLQP